MHLSAHEPDQYMKGQLNIYHQIQCLSYYLFLNVTMTRFDYESGCVKPTTNPISGQMDQHKLIQQDCIPSLMQNGDELSSIRYFYVQYLMLTISITL